jgi:type IV fimbrial biogenesis protein FimT
VFAVIATVAALALPALGSFLREQRLISWTYTLMGDLSLARSESIKRGVPVVMCRTVDGSSCHRHRGFRSDWSRGWILFANVDEDSRRDPTEPLLLHRQGPPPGLSLHFNQRWRISFRPDGRAKNGSFTLCAGRRDPISRAVVLYMTGRPRVSRRAAGGGPLRCGGA